MKAAHAAQVPESRERETRLAVVPQAQGRLIVHTEPWAKITVVMEDSHVIYLDLIALFIRAKHGRAVSRAELIRAFIEFMQQSRIDYTEFKNGDEIKDGVLAYLRGIAAHRRGRMPLLESGLFDATRTAPTARGVARRNIDVAPMEEEKR